MNIIWQLVERLPGKLEVVGGFESHLRQLIFP